MRNISRDEQPVYLFNAYSNLDFKTAFISGSDRVGLKLQEQEQKIPVIVAPSIFKKLITNKVIFISSDDLNFKNLFLRYIFRMFKTFKILFELSKDSNLKIISTSDFFPDVIPAFSYARNNNWYAFTYHLYPLSFSLRNFLGRLLQLFSYLLFKSSFKVITINSDCENFLEKNFRIKSLKIPLGLNTISQDLGANKNFDLVYLGRIKESKGVFDLPEIVSKIKIYYPKIKLFIIGNGAFKDLEKLLNLIKTFDVSENIEILKNLTDHEVEEYLMKSKILVQPSYEEGFGLSILEALNFNMRVVAYNLPVYEEHFSEFNLEVVSVSDKNGFAQKTIKLLKNFQNPNYPRNFFNKFSWENIYIKIFF